MRNVNLKKVICSLFVALICILSIPIEAYAIPANVHFGSETYNAEKDSEFPIGLYIESTATVGKTKIEVEYSPSYLEYIGDFDVSEGKIIINEDIGSSEGRFMLNFKVLAMGPTEIKVVSASAETTAGEQLFEIETLPIAPVNFDSEDELKALIDEQELEISAEERIEVADQKILDEKKVIEDAAEKETYWAKDLSDEELEKAINTNRRKELLKGLVVIMVAILAVGFTLFIYSKRGALFGVKRKDIHKKDKHGSDVHFDSLDRE